MTAKTVKAKLPDVDLGFLVALVTLVWCTIGDGLYMAAAALEILVRAVYCEVQIVIK